MRRFIHHFAFAALLTALPAAAVLAQSTTYQQRHDINNRRGSEQSRIHQGEASGQITHKGASNLEAHQHAIHSQERSDRAANGGHLTAQNRHQISREQNRQSQRVYKDKHNAATQPGVAPR